MNIPFFKRKLNKDTDDVDSKRQKKELFDALQKYFGYDDEEERYVNEVAEYFNGVPNEDKLDECSILPSKSQKNDLRVGQQIYINGEKDIYIILSISGNEITIKKTNDNKTRLISENDINNVINLNPESLYIDDIFLSKINKTNAEDFDKTESGILLKIKYYKNKITISKIKLKIYAETGNGGIEDENKNLITYNKELNQAIQELNDRLLQTNTLDKLEQHMNNVKIQFRSLYGISNASNVINFFNNNILSLFFSGVDKDLLLEKYIFFLDCISITTIAGVTESIKLASQGINPTKGWIYTCVNVFIRTTLQSVPDGFKNTVTNYVLLPSITYYLYTNMDTLYLTANNMIGQINALFTDALCVISNFNTSRLAITPDDNDTIATNISAASQASGNTLESIISEQSNVTSVTSLYDSLNVTNAEGNIESYGVELKSEVYNKIITQDNSVYSQRSHEYVLSPGSSYNDDDNDDDINGGDGGKKNRKTKKHKRMTIRGSKRSKKMKGGKRTRSTKKRRVVRRKKCNNTKRR